MTRAATFLGLMLLFPCPWYMIAVGGLLPLPVIVAYGADGGVVLAFSLVHLAVYAWIFHRVAWSTGSFVRHRGLSQQAGAVVVTAALVALSFVPIYGSGENLAAGNKFRYTAWEVYRDTFGKSPGARAGRSHSPAAALAASLARAQVHEERNAHPALRTL